MNLKPLVAFALLAGSAAVSAQMPGERESYGYIFAGVASPANNIFTRYQNAFGHLGGGGEATFNRYFGVGAEVGVLLPSGDRSQAVGLVSVGPYLHFSREESRFDPFVTAGYSALIRNGVGNLWHAGGGLNYWINRRLGVRAEFRNHVWPSADSLQLPNFRFGITLR
jgi:hypothetical protein